LFLNYTVVTISALLCQKRFLLKGDNCFYYSFPIGGANTSSPALATSVKEGSPGSNFVYNSQGQLEDPNLTDDTIVIEAPSFIVPYVYEKPPHEKFEEFKVIKFFWKKSVSCEAKSQGKVTKAQSQDRFLQSLCSCLPVTGQSLGSHWAVAWQLLCSRGRNDHFYFDLRSYPRSLLKN
jgi:hypothetical protein